MTSWEEGKPWDAGYLGAKISNIVCEVAPCAPLCLSSFRHRDSWGKVGYPRLCWWMEGVKRSFFTFLPFQSHALARLWSGRGVISLPSRWEVRFPQQCFGKPWGLYWGWKSPLRSSIPTFPSTAKAMSPGATSTQVLGPSRDGIQRCPEQAVRVQWRIASLLMLPTKVLCISGNYWSNYSFWIYFHH